MKNSVSPNRSIVSPEQRSAALVDRRNRKMAQSAHAFVRGTTARFYQWLASRHAPVLPDGPDVWICGDCHLGNLGPLADGRGNVDILIRDFDQAAWGNPSFDVCRLALSLSVLARSSDLPGMATAHILERLLLGYEMAFPEKPKTAPSMPPLLRMKVLRAHRRTSKILMRERTGDDTLKLPLGCHFWPLWRQERNALDDMFQMPSVLELVTQAKKHSSQGSIHLADAAYWRKGCSSLGNSRYAVLLEVTSSSRGTEDWCLMDIKEAGPALVPVRSNASHAISDHGSRVVKAATQLSPHLGLRMQSTHMLGKSFFVRQLMPQDMKLDIRSLRPGSAGELAVYLGYILGRAHMRQMSPDIRQAWKKDLNRARRKSVDAPSWLWDATVGLLADLEAAYLEHCRRHVMGTFRRRMG
ncbi:DUF2252 family protein [Dyella acidiphila]|uniref:DUF2252 family protein n=1 Tax=Dyella acidiphila TaxID=2775866 RepID=A0ABR9GBZ3_9GAMM|nr:DUF2252 family protein [Dyella acidiphila]MBE1161560.1 DUF2252 family protein [Dyella acidiphila]